MSRHIAIVGASDGIGLALAKRLHHEEVRLTTAQRHPCPLDGVEWVATDVSDYHQRVALAQGLAQNGPLDALVYLAGTSLCAPVETTLDAHYRYLWEVNYFGFAHLAALTMPLLRATKGRLMVVSSMAAVAPIPFDAHYSASKNALLAFVEALGAEVRPYGVRLTAALPGGVRTAFTFRRLVYDQSDCACYAHAAVNAAAKLERIEQRGMTPRAVADELADLLTRPEPPLVAPIGVGNRALYCLSRQLTASAEMRLIGALYQTTSS